MPYTDVGVLIAIVTGAIVSAVWLVRRGARGRLYLSAWSLALVGVVLISSMTAHLLDVLYKLYAGQTPQAVPFSYDFRAYSLLFLGVLLVAAGIHVLRLAARLSGRAKGTRLAGIRILLTVLAVVVPLIPIQAFFAIPLTVFAGVSLGLMALYDESPAEAIRPAIQATGENASARA